MVSDDDVRAIVIKQSRRKLLNALKMFFPVPVEFRTLQLTLPKVETRHLRVDLTYLIAKKLLGWVNEAPNAAWSSREFILSATGVEVADKITKDPALDG